MRQRNRLVADNNTNNNPVRRTTAEGLIRAYSLVFTLLFASISGGVANAAAPQWADAAHDALQSYKNIVDYWVGHIEPDTTYAYFDAGVAPPDPNTDPLWQVAERWNDDVELAQSLAAYWLLTGDQPLADMFRDMADKIQLAPAVESEVQGTPWIQPNDRRIEQSYTTTFVDPEHSAEETTLMFPRLAYVDFGEPTAIELMTRLIWNFQDNVPKPGGGIEENWAQPVNFPGSTGFLMRSPAYNARHIDNCWPGASDCSDPANDFLPQDTIGNFRSVAPGLSLLWYYGPSHYFWQASHPNSFMLGRNDAWIYASSLGEFSKPADVPPAKILVDSTGGTAWQGYSDTWVENDNIENNASVLKQGWNTDESIFRHFYHAMAAQMITTGSADASDIVGTAYHMRQVGLTAGTAPMAFERQFLQWRPEITNPQDYQSDDQALIDGNSGSINLGGDRANLTKNAYRRMMVAQLHLENFSSSGQTSDLNNAVARTLQGYQLVKQILANEEINWTSGLTAGSSGLTDQVKFDAMDAFLTAAIGGGGIYDAAYPSMLFSWNDTGTDVVSLVLDRDPNFTRLWVWNYGSQPEIGMRLWRITEGTGILRIGPDANQDGTMDSVTQTITIPEIRKGMEVRFTLPTSTDLQLIEIEVTTQQPRDLGNLPDPAIGYKDLEIVSNQANVAVHNIGTGATGNFTVRVFDTNGDLIGTEANVNLPGFTGTNPIKTILNWTIPAGKQVACVILDQDDVVNEITEFNNRYVLQSCNPSPTTTSTTSTTTTTTTTTMLVTTTTTTAPPVTTSTTTTVPATATSTSTSSTTTTTAPVTTTTTAPVTTTTTLPPPTGFPQSYYLLNPVTQTPLSVVSLVDNNTIQMSASVVLNQDQLGVIQVTEITGTGPFSVGSEADGTDTPVPDSFLATEFAVPQYRDNHTYYFFSPDAPADVTVTIHNVSTNVPVPQGVVVAHDAGMVGFDPAIIDSEYEGGVVTSTAPIVMLHKSGNDDVYPVPPPATELWGVYSQNVLVSALQNQTGFEAVSDKDDSWEWLDLPAGYQQEVDVGNSNPQGQGSGYYLSATKPIAAIQVDDGDGIEATSFWPADQLSSHYGIPVASQYIAVVCPTAGTVVTLNDGGNITNQVCSATGSSPAPGKAYFGSATIPGANISAGAIVTSDNPIYLIYEAANTNGERNVLGYSATPPYRYYLLNPVTQTPLSVVSLVDNNTIQMSASVVLNQDQLGVIQVTEITGTGPFSVGSEADGTDTPVPDSFLATEFAVPQYRDNHTYYFFSPDAPADVTVTIHNVSTNVPVPQGVVVAHDAGMVGFDPAIIDSEYEGGVVTSTAPIVMLHKSGNDDVYPVPPPATELWGVYSQNVLVSALQNQTGFEAVSDKDDSWEWLDLPAGYQQEVDVGNSNPQGQGSGYYLSATKPIAAIQVDDGDGIEATSFWPADQLSSHYGIPVASQYIAVVCPTAGTVVTLNDGGNITNQVCSATGSSPAPGKAYFGSATIPGANISAGAIVTSDNPIYLIYEAANTNGERNALGYPRDSDGDGLPDYFENSIGTNLNNPDSDSDGLTDYYEACYDGDCVTYDPYDPVTQTGGDLNATAYDTDQDGTDDGVEISAGTDPLDPLSFPGAFVPGDINDDGQVNVADILLAQRHVLGLTMLSPDQISRGDLYPTGGDGQITLPDLLLIQKIVLSLP